MCVRSFLKRVRSSTARFDANQVLYPRLPLLLSFFGPLIAFVFFNLPFSWSLLGLSLLIFFIVDGLGVQIGIHKLLCHRSFETSPQIRKVLAFLGVLSGQGSPLVWVAVHMGSHHPHYDTDKDIHSAHKGLWFAFLAWYWQCDKRLIPMSVAREYLKDNSLKFIHRHHTWILLGYWCLLGAVGGLSALVFLGWLPVVMSVVCAGLVNAHMHSHKRASHFWLGKYQTHSPDTTYNSVLLGFFTMGLGLHNNHHHRPSQVYYDEKWYEIDLSRLVIPLIRRKSN